MGPRLVLFGSALRSPVLFRSPHLSPVRIAIVVFGIDLKSLAEKPENHPNKVVFLRFWVDMDLGGHFSTHVIASW